MSKTLTQTGSVSIARSADRLAEFGLLNGSEIIILAIKPSLWCVLLECGRWLGVLLLIAVAAGLAERMSWLSGQMRLLLAACLVAMAVRLAYGLLRWQSRVYILTNLRVLRIRGLMRVEMFQCYLLRLKDVTLSVSMAERILGLGTIGLVSESSDGPTACWSNVRNPERVRRQILDAIDALKGQTPGQKHSNLPPGNVLPVKETPETSGLT